MKTVVITGADGYLGWPTCLKLSKEGFNVIAVDSYVKRRWMDMGNTHPLVNVSDMKTRVDWHNRKRSEGFDGQPNITPIVADVCVPEQMDAIFRRFKPDAIIHYAEQRSAPFSMADRRNALLTCHNNTVGVLNVLWSIKEHAPDCHFIHLGSMGTYGTPGVPIPEGFFEYMGTRLPFPSMPGSIYHATKVADAEFMKLLCRVWGLAATDLHQGVVWGNSTEEMVFAYQKPESGFIPDHIGTVFQYDGTWGTALNRFIVQSCVGKPITPYGKGGQTRGYIHLRDSIQCVTNAVKTPAKSGEYRVVNQFTEIFSVNDLAQKVADCIGGEIKRPENPRVELEDHFYEAANSLIQELGLKDPVRVDEDTIRELAAFVDFNRHLVDTTILDPVDRWK